MSIALIEIFGPRTDADWSFTRFVANVIQISVVGIPIAYIVVIAIGWPLHKLLSRFRLTSYSYYVLPAIVAGITFAYFMAKYNFLKWYVLSIVCAVIVASTFWFLVRKPKNYANAV